MRSEVFSFKQTNQPLETNWRPFHWEWQVWKVVLWKECFVLFRGCFIPIRTERSTQKQTTWQGVIEMEIVNAPRIINSISEQVFPTRRQGETSALKKRGLSGFHFIFLISYVLLKAEAVSFIISILKCVKQSCCMEKCPLTNPNVPFWPPQVHNTTHTHTQSHPHTSCWTPSQTDIAQTDTERDR